MDYARVLRAIRQPWAIDPDMLVTVQDIVDRRLVRGERLSEDEIAKRLQATSSPVAAVGGSVRVMGGASVLPMFGILGHRMNMMLALSGGTSTAVFAQRFREALADTTTGTIVFDVDSPGGMVDGVPELADEIYAARGKKRIVAVANTLMTSGAYWLSSQADEIVASPSAQIGSIGVYLLHMDQSKAMEDCGLKPTLISAGQYKTEGNPYQPLTDDAREFMQSTVDSTYGQFIKAVARGRGVSEAEVRAGYGQGRKLLAGDAKKAGLIDRVATFEETITRVSGRRAPGGRAAEDEPARVSVGGEAAAVDHLAAVALEQEQIGTFLGLYGGR